MNKILIGLIFLLVRLASVFVVQTFYVPDEYWQSLEVAHKLAFGYGYLTWEWINGLRSYIYPLIIAGLYKLLEFCNLDNVYYLVLSPRILQAIISAFSDYRFYIWNGKKNWSVFVIVISYFWFYTGSRTLANTFETALTTIALSYYPWHKEGTSYLWFTSLCCFMRPTAAIIWAPLCIMHLKNTKLSVLSLFFKRFVLIGSIVGGICVAIDSYFYGRLIVTPVEFLKYNVLHNIASFYGVHSWYWYFLTGLPTVLGINFIPFLFGVVQTIRNREMYPTRKYLLITIMICMLSYSCIAHKEFRFMLILLPFCLYICADTLSRWSHKTSKYTMVVVALIIMVGNIVPAWYLSVLHQKGPIDVMPSLAEISEKYRDENNNRANILFLMPCHSTPFYSHIHQNVTMRFLTCQPNLDNKQNYIDEADVFYKSPDKWIRSNIPSFPTTAQPTHLVLFEPLSFKIGELLKNYNIVHKIFHAEYYPERSGNYILVFERLKPKIDKNVFNAADDESNTYDNKMY